MNGLSLAGGGRGGPLRLQQVHDEMVVLEAFSEKMFFEDLSQGA